ncbi:hypothetical protein CRI94_13140 [Longibacter salinarum]|uniref:DUF2007 domain-containing protein n=1 Tax=Longibacter salinarum TaxID=1850348 RepID=A0A2A8CWK1_9BACT|nr:DUF2007 domain-containing protein [Longibacter salinarum]PEN12990.1 hypothetical protein CRI94_13140 [Longibacter salinarum]
MSKYENWVPVFSTGTDYEADMVRDRLDDAGLPAVVLTKRDHAFNLNVGDLANVIVLVPPENVDEAREVMQQRLTDEELEKAAMSADPNAPDAHTPEEQSRLDSGHDRVDFSAPDDQS